jgi:hypothetical protein
MNVSEAVTGLTTMTDIVALQIARRAAEMYAHDGNDVIRALLTARSVIQHGVAPYRQIF